MHSHIKDRAVTIERRRSVITSRAVANDRTVSLYCLVAPSSSAARAPAFFPIFLFAAKLVERKTASIPIIYGTCLSMIISAGAETG